MDGMDRFYEILGLNPGASSEEIKAAYRDMAKVWHPDRRTQRIRGSPFALWPSGGPAPGEERGRFWSWILQRQAKVMAALMIVGVLWAGAANFESFASGNRFLSSPMDYQIGYVGGVSDAFSFLATYESSPISIKYSQCIRQMTDLQIRAIAGKYLRDHPERWQYVMADLVHNAVIKSCPE